MIILAHDLPIAEHLRGALGFGRGRGGAERGKMRRGASMEHAGIYTRKRHGPGSLTNPGKKAGQWAISRMKFYRPTRHVTPKRQEWDDVFRAGKVAYDLLTIEEKASYSKQAIGRYRTGYNLFMSQWLQSHR
jgi:hypothetical protein